MMVAALAATITLISQTSAETPVSGTRITAAVSPINAAEERHMTSTECMRCHTVEAGLTHPTGMRPSMNVPEYLPLQGGLVTCTTCHEDTPSAHAQNRMANTPGGLLRAPWNEGGVVFCAQCHTGQSVTRQSMHPTGLDRAHLAWRVAPLGSNKIASTRHLQAKAVSLPSDDGSRSCITCHDGSVASDATGGTGGMGFGHSEGGAHPFGVPYQQARTASGSRSSDMGLKPVSALNSRIRLFNGQVGCQSCHSPYSTQRRLLVMSNDSSKLCLSCHEQR
ncbi:MAG: cytochrome c3 family protein [Phycisphaerae bacterium]